MSLVHQSAAELHSLLSARKVSSRELTQAFLDQIARHEKNVGAFLRIDGDRALDQADQIDRRRDRGEPVGKLAGLPVALKDNLCTRGVPTTCASRMLEQFVPPYDATVVTRLRNDDAVLLGRTNLDEFAMGGSTENSQLGTTRNPWNLACIPGGSSGGSAAALAASLVPSALGSDTGGSVRQPAGLCGVVGLKPTYGRVSRYGLVAFASSLDQIGPMGRSVEDIALVLESIAGHDKADSTSIDRPVPAYSQTVSQPLAGLTLGLVREHFGPGLDSEVEAAVRAAVKVYESQGAKVITVSMPHAKYAVAVYYIIAPCEASSNLARYDGVHYGFRCDEQEMLDELRREEQSLKGTGDAKGLADLDSPLVRLYRKSRALGFGPEVKRRIMLGTYALSAGYYDAYYLKALKVRRLIRNDFDAVFREVDLIVGPVTPTPAFRIGEKSDDPLSMYLVDLYTVSANLAGLPGICLPCGLSSTGLPIGLQLHAPAFEEEKLLRGAAMFQRATDWHTRRPPAFA